MWGRREWAARLGHLQLKIHESGLHLLGCDNSKNQYLCKQTRHCLYQRDPTRICQYTHKKTVVNAESSVMITFVFTNGIGDDRYVAIWQTQVTSLYILVCLMSVPIISLFKGMGLVNKSHMYA